MSAYLWPLSRTTVLDLNGDIVAGAWLNFWIAGTTTPLVAYGDSALTAPLPNVIEADASGRWPAVYLPYTDYRQRVRTPGGTLLFDDDGIANPAPATSGGGGTVPDSQLFKTGDPKWSFDTGPIPGFVRLNARTIGSAGSGATERANADTEDLYVWLWSRLDNTICPVSGGRGATGAADFAAGKTMQLPDCRGGAPFGVDDMGNSAAGRLTGVTFTAGDETTPGSSGGTSLVTLTNSQIPRNIPNTASSSSSTTTQPPSGFGVMIGQGGSALVGAGPGSTPAATGNVGSLASSTTTTTSVTINPSGGGSHNNMPPFFLVNWFIKL
jgi:microcystin-dependent protein